MTPEQRKEIRARAFRLNIYCVGCKTCSTDIPALLAALDEKDKEIEAAFKEALPWGVRDYGMNVDSATAGAAWNASQAKAKLAAAVAAEQAGKGEGK